MTLAPEVTSRTRTCRRPTTSTRRNTRRSRKRSAEVISTTDEAKAAALADQWRAGADWTAMQAAAQGGRAARRSSRTTRLKRSSPIPTSRKRCSAPRRTPCPPPIKGALGWFVIQVTKAVQGGAETVRQVKDQLRQRVRDGKGAWPGLRQGQQARRRTRQRHGLDAAAAPIRASPARR